ncbi:Modification methylase BspRI [Thalassoglobus neptunius]|uniref:DNA (cytosine-5-)-methyltransferase n=1 Tax=Thalassoglobus neptunius TaxID=1938619 RepID=A0A5C5VPX8_9PLAN|nr:DNA (cytosine-5-)-methyltransferase [Thalassoglobus neptunius]TWT39851.1 Modification methylase BspRI [Thalassoglobus neptunius]
MAAEMQIPVIDVFAGPGGLGEGFSSFSAEGCNPFRIALSIEKDTHAHQTLRLRSFFRQFARGKAPKIYYDVLRGDLSLDELPRRLMEKSTEHYRKWQVAEAESLHAELGVKSSHASISEKIAKAIGDRKRHWVLIGGPPCQAYSIVGRVRNRGNDDYKIEEDHRSTLYREYLQIIAEHQPSIFVMENVKGMLSATLQKQRIFEQILSDLSAPEATLPNGQLLRYRIVPIVDHSRSRRDQKLLPTDFIVACERFGVPQRRHRVILIGIREDLGDVNVPTLKPSEPPTVREMISTLPRLRSGLSRKFNGKGYIPLKDDPQLWKEVIQHWTIDSGNDALWLDTLADDDPATHTLIVSTVEKLRIPQKDRRGDFIAAEKTPDAPAALKKWIVDDRLKGTCNHESRLHMDSDLARYIFAACHAQVHGDSPKLNQFPRRLLPRHANAKDEKLIFDDRFRVQVAGSPATTVTSHLSKDGHYFIHYDPSQCRSMTVREVARLQTFPDNYLFCGPRTAQYIQVGNAVPPWVACQIAESVWKTLEDSGKIE